MNKEGKGQKRVGMHRREAEMDDGLEVGVLKHDVP